MPVPTIEWLGGVDGCARLIDQTLLPTEFRQIECRTLEAMWEAIKVLRVRGAPAIGVAAAFGAILGIQNSTAGTYADFEADLRRATDYLATSRPTAVNLFWALERMKRVAAENRALPIPQLKRRLLDEALAIAEEDKAICRAIGRHGAALIRDGAGVLTHCNAGGLATADYGTALAVMFAAHEQGKRFRVFADETRPLLQGARLTAWELMQAGIDVTLICDNMAAVVMRQGKVNLVIVGADRIAANGDTANKIGTYGVAILAKEHGVPFYVAAPVSTFDLSLPSGDGIPIEERRPEEVTHGLGRQTAPDGVDVYNPAFDVTPARLIAGIITERGVIAPVTEASVRATVG
ncbi:MAG TPA: S-methyl-5-thioribose-1-phosphate isomerase [Planctomycetota bacterium]|nr:S-methyl-5-thioribose-1-phosphate isomerase [Planctomycetota bacterium]HRR81245.1 S-methyl-5-thioribose-1-phosphate isomerase [Planctomycetota bacterium]HRT94662.1 S-methyl-5-thioribose-1-phosphate isomerase [Planctomycetota bacterium]